MALLAHLFAAVLRRRAYIDMTKPGVQKPHWEAWEEDRARCREERRTGGGEGSGRKRNAREEEIRKGNKPVGCKAPMLLKQESLSVHTCLGPSQAARICTERRERRTELTAAKTK